MSDKINYEFLPKGYPGYDVLFKIVLRGAVTGKTCLCEKMCNGKFPDFVLATSGFDYHIIIIKIDNIIIKLLIWDTCGQEVYSSFCTSYIRNSDLVMIVYAINDRVSFNKIDQHLNDAKSNNEKNCLYFLIGNKKDLEYERQVSKEEGEKFAKEKNFDFFIETSAKTGENLKAIFIEAAKILYLSHKKEIKKKIKERKLEEIKERELEEIKERESEESKEKEKKINDKLMKYISF